MGSILIILNFLLLITLPIIGGVLAIKNILSKKFVKFNIIYITGLIVGAIHCSGAGAIMLTSGWNGAFALSATLPLMFIAQYKRRPMGALLLVTLIIFSILNYQTGEMNKHFWVMLIMVQLPMLIYGLYYIIYADKFTGS